MSSISSVVMVLITYILSTLRYNLAPLFPGLCIGLGDLVSELRYSMSSRPNRSRRFLKTSGQYSLILKWLGRFSLLKAWLSIFTLEKARKSSGMSITGMLTCCNSFTVWLIPHMKTESRGSLERKSFLLGCFTLNRFVFILAIELSISTPPFGLFSLPTIVFSAFFLYPLSEPSLKKCYQAM